MPKLKSHKLTPGVEFNFRKEQGELTRLVGPLIEESGQKFAEVAGHRYKLLGGLELVEGECAGRPARYWHRTEVYSA